MMSLTHSRAQAYARPAWIPLVGITIACLAHPLCSLRAQSSQWTNGSGGAIYYNGGNVGIGTASPNYRLDSVGGFAHFGVNTAAVPPSDNTNGGLIVGWNQSDAGAETDLYNAFDAFGIYGTAFQFKQKTGPASFNDLMTIKGNGNVGIGTTAPQYPLSVNGTIQAKEVLVNTGWSDYVFAPDYRLPPLSEVNTYTQAHHHLPDIPSQAEVKENGVSVGDMQAKLLAKIEELTLHLIQADEKNRQLEDRLARLEAERGSAAQKLIEPQQESGNAQ